MKELVALVDGDALRAPAPGWFRRLVEPDHLIAPGDALGELEIIGRTVRVVAPAVRGIVQLPVPELGPGGLRPTGLVDRRRAVGYGDVLVRLGGDLALAAATPAPSTAEIAAHGPVFRAPTSGRFYGRPAPDKPAFVEPGRELVPGSTICLLEVMKTFHRVTYSGDRVRVKQVLVADGADVNAGEPLLALESV